MRVNAGRRLNILRVLAHRQRDEQRLGYGSSRARRTNQRSVVGWLMQLGDRVRLAQQRRTCEGSQVSHEILRQTRIARRWSQKALAFRLGISTDWLHKIELGKGVPNSELAVMIAAWLADQNAAGPRLKSLYAGTTTAD